MSVELKITYSCDGCFCEIEVVKKLNKRFYGITGIEYGFGHYEVDKIDSEKMCPDGWIAFDPYTQCTYCHNCWKSIIG